MDSDDLVLAGASEQALLIQRREVSARELVRATLDRIDALNPLLNAYRVVYRDEALAAAERIDDGPRVVDRPLAGVPVAIKDDIDVAGDITAWGTDAYGPPKRADAEVITRLRRAGAILIGKTHVPEMTLWPWTASKTWGVTRNPWDLERTCGGSSGGSAVAAATGMCGVALGSDGGGSVRYPAALTGLFGLKTARGRVPLGPDHVDAWNGLEVYGPLARTVRDAALFLDCTADDGPPGGYLAALDLPPRRLRIAVSLKAPPGTIGHLDRERRGAIQRLVEVLRSLGHDVHEHEIDYGLGAIWNATVRFLAGVHDDVGALARPERLEPNTRRLAKVGGSIPRRWLARTREAEQRIADRMNGAFDRADVVLTPMTAGPPPQLNEVLGRGLVRSFASSGVSAWALPWNTIGQPAASVPCGLDSGGLPIAVQLCGRPGDEATLMALAAQIEAVRPWRHVHPDLRALLAQVDMQAASDRSPS